MESAVANEDAARNTHNPAPQSGSATPRVTIAIDDTRKVRTLNVKAAVDNLSFYYGQHRALKNLTIPIAERQVTALIGPSGCGKSTFLRCLNRMNDLIEGTRHTGGIHLDGKD
ncbi:MAG TPA: ATP-binding cassette domain-containing protein, partial [Steroidobacteraceae bacterium]|nr:ATP-binding cassette domain-containing protein [Steroidobacteraceae bacterium]